MAHFTNEFAIETRGQGLYMITQQVADWVGTQNVRTGLLTAFIQHTSASLVIQENADPDVIRDINEFFKHLVKENAPFYRHKSEGPDDMPSHIRSVLTASSISIPVVDGRMALGTWQGIYVFEHRAHPHRRSLVLHLAGESK
jgi:secondary thiamine-phosphate synthase enzyme